MRHYQDKYPISDKAEYVIDYVYDNPSGASFYYQLVRLSDNAILFANQSIQNIYVHCWRYGIAYDKVSII